ncbi:interleukin 17a/f2 [Odontesthes bonariensis]|uniref:interleukin 17a/f2 n=1 Tax=Odontesthes bonariensis TaxID=219752 RepID=UPI003F58F2F0
MKLLRRLVYTLLACCSALWVASSSEEQAPPPACSSTLEFSSEVQSSSQENGKIHHRSLSPWSWRSTSVKNRIPATLWEAECSSMFCSGPDQTENHNLNSVPIHQSVLVLTRKDDGRCYVASYRSVAVGCTCIRAKASQN